MTEDQKLLGTALVTIIVTLTTLAIYANAIT